MQCYKVTQIRQFTFCFLSCNEYEITDVFIFRNTARYDFTHEILGSANSKFGEHVIPRGRRISVICRNEPSDTTEN